MSYSNMQLNRAFQNEAGRFFADLATLTIGKYLPIILMVGPTLVRYALNKLIATPPVRNDLLAALECVSRKQDRGIPIFADSFPLA